MTRWAILHEREAARMFYSAASSSHKSKLSSEEEYYSIRRSRAHKADNRYSDIFAYDRTAVGVEGEGYLNANVVCDGYGGWWVAAQASYIEGLAGGPGVAMRLAGLPCSHSHTGTRVYPWRSQWIMDGILCAQRPSLYVGSAADDNTGFCDSHQNAYGLSAPLHPGSDPRSDHRPAHGVPGTRYTQGRPVSVRHSVFCFLHSSE